MKTRITGKLSKESEDYERIEAALKRKEKLNKKLKDKGDKYERTNPD